MPTAVEVLTEARRLIAEKGWCQKAWCILPDGKRVADNEGLVTTAACAFCADGAVIAASRDLHTGDVDAVFLLDRALGEGSVGVIAFNDEPGRTRDQVIAIFDRAIELAKAEP